MACVYNTRIEIIPSSAFITLKIGSAGECGQGRREKLCKELSALIRQEDGEEHNCGAAYCPCAMPKTAPLFVLLSPPPSSLPSSLPHFLKEIIVGGMFWGSNVVCTALNPKSSELPHKTSKRLSETHLQNLLSPVWSTAWKPKNLHAKVSGIAVALETGKNYPRAAAAGWLHTLASTNELSVHLSRTFLPAVAGLHVAVSFNLL